ncbi:putative neuropeptide Y receptor type 6 [Mya arenaria]|uniref:putative neuropeptide Y receptor type 6 n=1 Tax=Mya arenaria TaxID=6604 RepID=UPI0022E8D89E|nr:putative neuropeptide Y receptor type 6 [Mya arenaria]
MSRNNMSQNVLYELNDRYATTLLPSTIVLGVFGIVGIFGNIFVFIVYGCGKKFKDRKFRYFVVSLGLIDLLTCLTLIPAEILKHRTYFNFTERHLCKMKCFMNVFAAAGASYCLMLVAVDRYILTCRPMLCKNVPKISHSWAWRLCLIMLLMAVLTSIPAGVLCGITYDVITDVYGNVTAEIYACESEPYFEDGISRYVYRIFLSVIQILISLLMIVLYARIGHTVLQAMKIRESRDPQDVQMYDYRTHWEPRPKNGGQQLGTPMCGPHHQVHQHHHHHHHIPTNIKLLFIVTVVFIVTYVLYLVLSWIDQKQLTQTQFLVFSMFYRSYFIHSIINPILYLKMDKHFRGKCRRLMKSLFCVEKLRRLRRRY